MTLLRTRDTQSRYVVSVPWGSTVGLQLNPPQLLVHRSQHLGDLLQLSGDQRQLVCEAHCDLIIHTADPNVSGRPDEEA